MSTIEDDSLNTSLAAATALARLDNKAKEDEAQEKDYSKLNINKLKSANEIDKNELKKLNFQLEQYLDKAKQLEALNQELARQVELEKQRQIPKGDNNKDLRVELDKARIDLENESKDCVRNEIDVEKNDGAIQEYKNRIKFYLNENDLQKQKIAKLSQALADIDDERDYIMKSATQVENDIIRDQDAMFKAEGDLEELRNRLADLRNKNKDLEFEMQTLQDEKEFSRALHEVEVAALKNSVKAVPSTRDLNKFYKDQLKEAVRDIRSDFQRLTKQQLDALKNQKEAELAFHKDNAEKQRAAALRKATPIEKEVADITLSNLPDINRKEREELIQLNAKNIELENKLADLENQLANLRNKNANEIEKRDDEIKHLKELSDNYLNELDYWDRVTRAKTESEMQAYRSLLNCQNKLLQGQQNPATTSNDYDKTKVESDKSKPASSSPSSQQQQQAVPITNKLPPQFQEPEVQQVTPITNKLPPPAFQDQQSTSDQNKPSTVLISSVASNKPSESQSESSSDFKPANVIVDTVQPSASANVSTTRPSTVIISSAQSGSKPSSPSNSKLPSPSATKAPSPSSSFQPIQQRPAPISPPRSPQRSPPPEPKESAIRQQLRRVFELFDKDKSGYINSSEFQNVLAALDINLSKESYEALLKEADADKSKDIDFEEFCKIMEPAVTGAFKRDELYAAFKHFDKDNSGYITVQELSQILSQMGQTFSDKQIASLVASVDEDNDGRLSFEEFYTLLTRPVEDKPVKATTQQQTKKKSVTIVTPDEAKKKSGTYDVLRKVFDSFDRDKSGHINSSELNDAFQALDLQISDAAYESIMKEADLDNSRDITFDEFCKIMEPALSGEFNREDLYVAFKHFDKDNSGYITVKELSQIMSQIGQSFSEEQIAKMVARVDVDNDGRLSFDEFVQLMTTPLDK